MSSGPVAILDIGSNSIKILVADRTADGTLATLAARTLDARISAGISRARPQLSEDGMQRGLTAIEELLALAAPFAPRRTILVATSAVRDATNGGVFRDRVRTATSQEIRILTGDEEADLIGRGLRCDPALGELRDFYVFDLGGGSLECLAFRDRRVRHAISLQLGCVRLTEKLVAAPALPLPPSDLAAISAHTREVFAASPFRFELPRGATAVGTGGTLTTARAMLGARAGQPLEATSTVIPLDALRELLDAVARLPLPERKKIPGLPAARADVFPAALATLVAVGELGSFDAYRHSLYNLRYGLAAEALA